MRRMMASCCQSFWPNTAVRGMASWNSFMTTVHTPRKWVGRETPHSVPDSVGTSTQVA